MEQLLGAALLVAAKSAGTHVQWATLAWIAGAVIAAALIITVIVVVSRRPKSMEDGIEEFARSLQAVAPARRPVARQGDPQPRQAAGRLQEQRPARRGEA
jgi:putative exporter of polyketide antibiotics